MLGRIFTVGGYTLLSRLTGFARDIMLAAILGAGPVADAFFIAFRLPKGIDRDQFQAALKAQGIPTVIYYPKSMHQQTAYRIFLVADGGLPVSERVSSDVISLPMHAYLDEATQSRIIAAVRGAVSA